MTTELIPQPAAGLTIDHLPTIKETLAHYNLVQEVRTHIMKKDVHFGESFPGDVKLNLLKPGADSLGVAFQLIPDFEVDERDLGGGHREYRVTAKIHTRSGALMATGVGTCSTMETKYRWRQGQRLCPTCGKAAIIKGKEEYGGGWVCYQKKGGCNAKFKDADKAIEGQSTDRVENTDIADCWNTCLKIGKKRAYVDGMITATGASDMFTQDAEDFRPEAEAPRPGAAAAPAQFHGDPADHPAAQPKPAAKTGLDLKLENQDVVDPIALMKGLNEAANVAALGDAWGKCMRVQGALAAKDILELKKVWKAKESDLAKGGA